MKKFAVVLAAVVVAVIFSGCGSARTPTAGPRNNYVWYNTFFGISFESAVYGDGLIVGQK